MCFDEKTSIITFAIGTIFNIYGVISYQDIKYTAIAILWEWILLMQVFDAIAWRNPDCGNEKNKLAARGAYIANMTQPLVCYLVLIIIADEVSLMNKIISSILILAYICSAFYSSQEIEDVNCLERTNECANLQYYWWENQKVTLCFYLVCILGIPILLFRPLNFAVYTSVFILATLFLSMFIYSCGTASVWCWFAAFAPVLNYFMWKYFNCYYYA